MKSCIVGVIVVFSLVNFEECLDLDQYKVTFPCGRPEDKQRCRFPHEFCDTTQGSCLQCNEDICREQDSDPSCRAFCYDLEHPGTTSTEGKSVFFSHEATISFFVVCVALVFAIPPVVIYIIRRGKRGTNNTDLKGTRESNTNGNELHLTEKKNFVVPSTS